MKGARSLALVASCAALAASCARAPLEWRIRFAASADRASTSVVEARVRRDACDGPVVWQGAIASGAAWSGMSLPSLAPGRYALEAVARDAECREVASACSLVTAPFGEPFVSVLASTPGPASCAPERCVAGVCDCAEGACVDAGRADALVLDAAAVDARALDAFASDAPSPSSEDVGTDSARGDAFDPDAFVVPPAAPVVVAPWNGVSTGAPLPSSPLEDPPLRPLFVWEPVAGAGSYVVELFRCDVAEWRTCSLDVPTSIARFGGDATRGRPEADLPVSTTAPVGARYVFRVGACTTADHRGCAFSEPRYLDVGRSATDVDGDGRGDLLAVAASAGSDATIYEVRLGASETDPSTLTARLSQPALESLAAIGDYDGDGIAEVVASAPIAEPDAAGGRFLYLDGAGLVPGGEDRSGTVGAGLGRRIVRLGDLDGDGYADFAVTAPGNTTVPSEVRVYYGGPSFDPINRVLVPRPSGLEEFGRDVAAAGDINGDGRADLAVLARNVGDALTVQVRFFIQRDPSSRVLRELPTERFDVASGFTGGTDPYGFGRLDAAGDVDGDGRGDVAVGQFRSSAVVVGRPLGPVLRVMSPRSDAMGSYLALGDLDGTGRVSILASRLGEPSWRGYSPNGTALVRYDPLTDSLTVRDYDTSVDLASAGSDYDGDGRDDAVLRAPAGLVVHLEDDGVVRTVPPPAGQTWGPVAY